uniref:Uncharacterized protein n=1 Tax=Noccaea caerulescens TaxID=107243 RepID=A0A1J3EK85_NOCCA
MSIISITLSFHLCPEQRDALLEYENELEIGKPASLCEGLPNMQSWANNSDVVIGVVSHVMPNLGKWSSWS